jgi:threonyl-tRNA synthetase
MSHDGANGDELDILRHSTAHVMAKAVQRLYPGSKLAIGPTIENGFYYDIDIPEPVSVDDLPRIEAEMREIVAANEPFVRSEMPRDEALAFFQRKQEPYKVEIVEGVEEPNVSLYATGDDWIDLCRGPHVAGSGEIKAFKLTSVAGAYWRGDEKRPMLQRIYGTAWFTQDQLDHYLWQLEEAKRRDHRVLARELDLFSVSDEVGPGLILWHPKGALVRVVAEDFSRRAHLENGYEWVFTPHVGRARLWQTSGHLDFYKDSMYAPMDVEGDDYYVKPMNCPFHIQIYKTRTRSYRELPKRYAELGTVYRYERSGVVHGLTRVRGFTQDDAHIFCRPDQVEAEIGRTIEFSLNILRAFGLADFKAYLATRPEDYVGEVGDWDRAASALRRAAEFQAIPLELDEGGGAFYGPKIDLRLNDALGREWQLSTIQFDFNLPARFDLEYIADDGQAHRPYMVHRALMGSIERFFGILIEHYAGAFPLWLAPVQAVVVPIADRHLDYAASIAEQLRADGFRAEVDGRREKMQAKIRDAQLQKVPYMLVVGDRDVSSGAVSVRERERGDLGQMPLDEAIDTLKKREAART